MNPRYEEALKVLSSIDFHNKTSEIKKLFVHAVVKEYALHAVKEIEKIHKRVLVKLKYLEEGMQDYKPPLLKDLEFIENNLVRESNFPHVLDGTELATLTGFFHFFRTRYLQLRELLTTDEQQNHTRELWEKQKIDDALTALLQEEQLTYTQSPLFKRFLLMLKAEIKEKNAQPGGIYFAYAWPTPDHQKEENGIQGFLKELKNHLELSGITTARMDIVSNRYGANIYDYMKQAETDDYVLLFGTKSLKTKHDSGLSAVCTEVLHILRKREEDKKKGLIRVFPILLSGAHRESFPVEYERYITVRDWRTKDYASSFQELYLELFTFKPEYYLPKVKELWTQLLDQASSVERDDFIQLQKEYGIKRHHIIQNEHSSSAVEPVTPPPHDVIVEELPRKKKR